MVSEPGPVQAPLMICALFAFAAYLWVVYAVNRTTFADACTEDVRWAAVLNYFSLLAGGVIFVFAAVSVYALARQVSSTANDSGSTAAAAKSAPSQ